MTKYEIRDHLPGAALNTLGCINLIGAVIERAILDLRKGSMWDKQSAESFLFNGGLERFLSRFDLNLNIGFIQRKARQYKWMPRGGRIADIFFILKEEAHGEFTGSVKRANEETAAGVADVYEADAGADVAGVLPGDPDAFTV
jgi:hypothetical protein